MKSSGSRRVAYPVEIDQIAKQDRQLPPFGRGCESFGDLTGIQQLYRGCNFLARTDGYVHLAQIVFRQHAQAVAVDLRLREYAGEVRKPQPLQPFPHVVHGDPQQTGDALARSRGYSRPREG